MDIINVKGDLDRIVIDEGSDIIAKDDRVRKFRFWFLTEDQNLIFMGVYFL